MDQAIKFLSHLLNQHIKKQLGFSESDDENYTHVGRLINQDGTIPIENQNKLILSFVSLSQETTKGMYANQMGFSKGGYSMNPSPLYYNLDIVLAAVFDDELEGLKLLTKGVEFFHENAQLDRSTFPDMPNNLDKITLELVNLPLKDSESLWSAIGAKAVPSALYKVRVISVNNSTIEGTTPSISGDQPQNKKPNN